MNSYEPRAKTKKSNQRNQQKRKTTAHRASHDTQHDTLPVLTIPNDGEEVIAVTVKEQPLKGAGGAKVWVADEAPSRRLGGGQLISLRNSSGATGPGLLTAITDLRQHWITWSVSGSQETVRVQVPVPWTDMTGVGAIAHARHFSALPALPSPHKDATPNATTTDGSYPYESNIPENEKQQLEDRLNGITKRKWEWGPEEERKRRRRRPSQPE